MCDFWYIMISQGSAASYFRYHEKHSDYFVAKYVLHLAMKEFWKSINISRSYRPEYDVLFLTHSADHVSRRVKLYTLMQWVQWSEHLNPIILGFCGPCPVHQNKNNRFWHFSHKGLHIILDYLAYKFVLCFTCS